MSAIAEPPCVLDIEASGFGSGSYPIEVGYVLPDGRTRCTLIRPAAHWTHWSESAERIHGISRAVIERHGREPGQVARMLDEDLAGLTVYCDGWAHDFPWLCALFDEAGMPLRFRLESVRKLVAENALVRLPELQREARAALGVERHRASHDARVLQWALGQLGRA